MIAHMHARVRPARPARRLAWLALGGFCVAFVVFEVAKHGGLALALALVFAIAPDLAMLIGASRKLAPGQLAPKAVPFYNAVHRAWGPVALMVASIFFGPGAAMLTGGLAWLAHVAIDRAAGFGLRTPEGFQRG